MERILKVTLPYPVAAATAIERRLSARDCIVYFDQRFPRYSLMAYHHDSLVEKHEYYALADLNVLSTVLSIARGAKASDIMRDAAGLMAFLMSFDCMIEPGMSAQDYATINGVRQTQENIDMFRRADNISPAIYADMACGKIDHVPRDALPPPLPRGREFRPFVAKPYAQQYAALLKLGMLTRRSQKPIEKLRAFMAWQRDEYFFGSCVTVYAVLALAPQPVKDPLKQQRSAAKHDRLKGVRNTAWDMSIAQYWAQRTMSDSGKNRRWLLCTFDSTLKELARSLIVSTTMAPEEQMNALIASRWPEHLVDEVMSVIEIANGLRNTAERRARVSTVKANIAAVITALEEEF